MPIGSSKSSPVIDQAIADKFQAEPAPDNLLVQIYFDRKAEEKDLQLPGLDVTHTYPSAQHDDLLADAVLSRSKYDDFSKAATEQDSLVKCVNLWDS